MMKFFKENKDEIKEVLIAVGIGAAVITAIAALIVGVMLIPGIPYILGAIVFLVFSFVVGSAIRSDGI